MSNSGELMAKKVLADAAHIYPLAKLTTPACFCRESDAWRCAVDQNLTTVACTCSCHIKRI